MLSFRFPFIFTLCISERAQDAEGLREDPKKKRNKAKMQLLCCHFALSPLYTGFPTRSPPVLLILGVRALCYQIKRDKGKAEPGVLWATVIAAPSVNAHGTEAGGVRTALPRPRCTDCYLLYVSITSCPGVKLHGSSYPHPP